MSEFQEDVLSVTWHKIKSTRTHVLCVCRLPEEVRDRLPVKWSGRLTGHLSYRSAASHRSVKSSLTRGKCGR